MYYYKYQKYLTKYREGGSNMDGVSNSDRVNIYGTNYPEMKDKWIYKLLLKTFNKFALEYNIPYIIAYGTLLGQVRDGDFIPYDNDIDIIIDRDGISKLFTLLQDGSCTIPMILNNKLMEHPLKYDNTSTLILNSSHPYETRGQRYTCNGSLVKKPMDGCSFKGLIGRLVYMTRNGKSFYLDMFGYFGFKKWYGHSSSSDCINFNFPIVPCKLSGIDTYRPDDTTSHNFLRKRYGDNYLIADHKYNRETGEWVRIGK